MFYKNYPILLLGLQLVYQCSKTNFARNHSAGRPRSQPLHHLQAWQETPLVHDLFAASLSLLHSLPADHGISFHKNTNHQWTSQWFWPGRWHYHVSSWRFWRWRRPHGWLRRRWRWLRGNVPGSRTDHKSHALASVSFSIFVNMYFIFSMGPEVFLISHLDLILQDILEFCQVL